MRLRGRTPMDVGSCRGTGLNSGHQLLGGHHRTVLAFELFQRDLLGLKHFKKLFRDTGFPAIGLRLQLDPGQDVIDIQGKLLVIERLGVFLFEDRLISSLNGFAYFPLPDSFMEIAIYGKKMNVFMEERAIRWLTFSIWLVIKEH